MYIDTVPNRHSPPAVLLRESYRKDGKVKKRTLANLSKLPMEGVECIRLALAGKAVVLQESVCGPVYAVLFVLNELARCCGLHRALGDSRLAALTLFLVLARIAHQGSRLSAVRWAQDHALKEAMGLDGFDEDDLYQALDWAASQQTRIEDKLYRQYVKRSGQSPALVLYDVTSSYLEGEHNELGAYGYNRDGKKGKKQIVIGLLTGQDGEPLSIQVFKGNTADPATFGAQVETLVQRFEVEQVVVVGDRGMIKTEGKKRLNSSRFQYITALTDPQIRKLIDQDIIQPGLFDEEIVEVTHNDKRLVLRCDPATKRKERYRRGDKIQRLLQAIDERNTLVAQSRRTKPEAGLKQLTAWARHHKLSAFTELTLESRHIVVRIDQEAKRHAELLDGCYCIESDVSPSHLEPQEIHNRYKDLQQVERDFRRLKTDFLEIRPIFVRKEQRTRGHVFIAMLSLKVVRLMEQRLHSVWATTDTNADAETPESALSALSRLCLQLYRIGDKQVIGLPRPDARQEQILSALKVNLTAP